MYTPDWVLNVVCAKIAVRYVLGDLPIEAFANRMSRALITKYSDCRPEKLYGTAEDMLFFLAEIEDEDALDHCHRFIYNSVMFDKAGRQRRMKGFFFDPLSPVKALTSSKEILSQFRVFTHKSRANTSLSVPEDWSVGNIKELKVLAGILEVHVTFADAI
jgi:hypothetical protein|tara:strand:- start:724 stop:1203 length:480 start_codon:yes stop_codon:yes gene_type:complete